MFWSTLPPCDNRDRAGRTSTMAKRANMGRTAVRRTSLWKVASTDGVRQFSCGEEGVRKQEGLRREETMRVAVVGAGLSGLAAAHELARSGCADVTLYEKENYLGGQAKTVAVDDGGTGNIDLGLMVFNRPSVDLHLVSISTMLLTLEEMNVEHLKAATKDKTFIGPLSSPCSGAPTKSYMAALIKHIKPLPDYATVSADLCLKETEMAV
ncbi:hypothetical protein PR202_gn00092 [Eleusine coracana subsp. coracana]|uniref:Amine oxidase domain-containing protein n=1 Tax=Eleusine coracana subsp. coracana TaxID=191504 RepID=A0AAV5G1R2_ELECO|nr:hypothetical protein PR202_gn00092 [Eleusine coracana subsp. coracana]